MSHPTGFDLDELYRLVGSKEAGLDLIFAGADRLFAAGRFDACDELLRAVDLTRLSAPLIAGLLNATLPASDRLPERPAFVERAFERLCVLRGREVALRLCERHRPRSDQDIERPNAPTGLALDELYRFVGKEEVGLGLLFRGMRLLFAAGRFDTCDELLRAVDLTRLSAPLILGLLNATLPASDRLPGRPAFFEGPTNGFAPFAVAMLPRASCVFSAWTMLAGTNRGASVLALVIMRAHGVFPRHAYRAPSAHRPRRFDPASAWRWDDGNLPFVGLSVRGAVGHKPRRALGGRGSRVRPTYGASCGCASRRRHRPRPQPARRGPFGGRAAAHCPDTHQSLARHGAVERRPKVGVTVEASALI